MLLAPFDSGWAEVQEGAASQPALPSAVLGTVSGEQGSTVLLPLQALHGKLGREVQSQSSQGGDHCEFKSESL